jgi:F-type H+-transporting ATPase subunit b
VEGTPTVSGLFDLHTFLWEIFNFLVILAILYRFFYRPVLNFMDKRRDEIARNIAESEQRHAEAEKLLEEYRAQLAASRQDAQQIIDRATKAGEEERQALLAQSRNEAAALLESARSEIRRERDEAMQTLRQEVVTLAMAAAGKILERDITSDDNVKIVNQFLDKVGEIH